MSPTNRDRIFGFVFVLRTTGLAKNDTRLVKIAINVHGMRNSMLEQYFILNKLSSVVMI